jgi:ArsR family transcriptional regulator
MGLHRLYSSINMELSNQWLKLMETKLALAALAGLAQESRLAVFRLLVEAGPAGVPATQIAERLGVPSSSLSFHLKELTHAALVTPRQDGRFVIYTANFSTMDGLMAYLTANCCGGNPCTTTCPPVCSTTKGVTS